MSTEEKLAEIIAQIEGGEETQIECVPPVPLPLRLLQLLLVLPCKIARDTCVARAC